MVRRTDACSVRESLEQAVARGLVSFWIELTTGKLVGSENELGLV